MDDKSSMKGAWSGHVNHLNFGRYHRTNRISGTTEAIVGYVKSQHTDDKRPLEEA